MKIIISSYGTENETIGLYEISDLRVKRLDYDSIIKPSYVTSGDGFIYTYEIKDEVYLYSYKIGEKLEKIDMFKIPGTGVTHLTYSPKNKILLGCSYGDGTFFSVGVNNGKFTNLYTYDKQINDDRLSRCHAIITNNKETEVAVVNIALDAIFIYDIVDGKLLYKDKLVNEIGAGPRHAIYSDDDKFIYAVTEYSNEIIVYDREIKAVVQSISTIPNFNNTSYGATLLISKDRKYLYATNRGEDSIAKFRVGKKIEYLESFPCGGEHPRHMIITRDGRYIINCNKNSNNVAFFDVEEKRIVLTIPFYQPSGIIEV